MNLPNVLTIIRMCLIPVFVVVFFSDITNHLLFATLIFILAGLTDVLDGYIARKYNMITKWGQVMDPLADKLMQLTVLICLTIDDLLPIWIVLIYGLKEVLMIVGGIILYYSKKRKIIIPANYFGKVATILVYLAVLSMAFDFKYSMILFMIAIGFSVVTFFQYYFIGQSKLKKLRIEHTRKIAS